MTDLTDERLRDVAEFHRDPVTRNIARELLAHRTNGGDPVRVWDDDAKCWREPTASPVSIPQDDPQSIASLLSIIADIREASGVGAKPMLSELAEAIRAKLPQDGTSGVRVTDEIAAERRRQIEAEGWTLAHDDQHSRGEMASAAGVYALAAGSHDYRWVLRGSPVNDYLAAAMKLWPWDQSWFKPKDRRRDLVKAAALIVAEIERLDRLAALEPSP